LIEYFFYSIVFIFELDRHTGLQLKQGKCLLQFSFFGFHLDMFQYLSVIEIKLGAPALPAAAAPVASRVDATITTPATADFSSIRIFLMGLSLFRHHDATLEIPPFH